MTYTFVTLEVSAAAYDEIRAKLLEAKYNHTILPERHEGHELIDMHGIALLKEKRTTDIPEHAVVDNHCPECNEFESECLCEEADGPINPRDKSRTTRAQRRTQADTREHRTHKCNHPGACGVFCHPRGYHECKCGATKGVAPSSEWVKSHASSGYGGWG